MVERRFPRQMSALEAVMAFVREFLARHGAARDATLDVELIVEELFTNVVRHARGGTPEVALALDWRAPTLVLRLRDFEVEPFDVTRVPPPDLALPLAARRRGGLGLHLVRRIADRVEYAYRGGNTVTVTKRLDD